MNDELKAHVNAYMDGLEVEYRFNMKWYVVESFSDFDGTSADYRIKPKAEDKALELQEERDSLVIEVNELTSTNKELWATIKSLPTIAEDALISKLKEEV